jgi:hypothetical protein
VATISLQDGYAYAHTDSIESKHGPTSLYITYLSDESYGDHKLHATQAKSHDEAEIEEKAELATISGVNGVKHHPP